MVAQDSLTLFSLLVYGASGVLTCCFISCYELESKGGVSVQTFSCIFSF